MEKGKLKSEQSVLMVWFGASQHPNGDPNSPPQKQWVYPDGTEMQFSDWIIGRA